MSFRQIQDLIPVSISTWRTWIAGGIVSEPEVRGNNLFWWSDEIRSLIQSFGGKELGFYRVAKVKEIFNYMTDSGVYKAADRGALPHPVKLGLENGRISAWVVEDVRECAQERGLAV